jgi:hypothetical protein
VHQLLWHFPQAAAEAAGAGVDHHFEKEAAGEVVVGEEAEAVQNQYYSVGVQAGVQAEGQVFQAAVAVEVQLADQRGEEAAEAEAAQVVQLK